MLNENINTIAKKILRFGKNTAQNLSGSRRRYYMEETVSLLGVGGRRFAEKVLGWNRVTIRKGNLEIKTNTAFIDKFHDRGRKRVEAHFPNLLDDIKSIADPICQTDPTFRSKRLYCPLTADEIHRRLHADKGYKLKELPTVKTIRNKLSELKIRPSRVKKMQAD